MSFCLAGWLYQCGKDEEDFIIILITLILYLPIITNNVYKTSPNIIDLIEEGDILSYKDGSICRVLEIADGYYLLKDIGGEQYYEKEEWLKDFKSVVTKEQFEEMEYKL